MKLRRFFLILTLFAGLWACTPVTDPLSSAELAIDGSGTYSTASTLYIYANAAGAVTTSTNAIEAIFSDPDTPLILNSYTGVFTAQLNTGSCTSISNLIATVNGDAVETNLSATGCVDQTTLTISMDTSQVFDQSGFNGWALLSLPLTVDLAPEVSVVATGNSAADGSGTTESSSGYFNLTGGTPDASIVVTFTKDLTGGALNATLTGSCPAGVTLGTPTLVTGSNGTTVAWPLDNLGFAAASDICTLNVSGVKDVANNADDPTDPHLTMNFTFH